MAAKYQVTVPPHHGACIEEWAQLEGRQLSTLCALPQPIADRLRFRQ